MSYNEFLQQYKELTDWLGYLQVAVSRQTASRSESYLNQVKVTQVIDSFIIIQDPAHSSHSFICIVFCCISPGGSTVFQAYFDVLGLCPTVKNICFNI